MANPAKTLQAKKFMNQFSGIFEKRKEKIESTRLSDVKVSDLHGRRKEDTEGIWDESARPKSQDFSSEKIKNQFSGIFEKGEKEIENTRLSDVKVLDLFKGENEDAVRKRDESTRPKSPDSSSEKIKNQFSGIFAKGKEKIENARLSDVKVPDLFGRGNEDTKGIKDESTSAKSLVSSSEKIKNQFSDIYGKTKEKIEGSPLRDVKMPDLIGKAKEHISYVKVPDLIGRVKEQIGDFVGTGIWSIIGNCLKRVCCPGNDKKD